MKGDRLVFLLGFFFLFILCFSNRRAVVTVSLLAAKDANEAWWWLETFIFRWWNDATRDEIAYAGCENMKFVDRIGLRWSSAPAIAEVWIAGVMSPNDPRKFFEFLLKLQLFLRWLRGPALDKNGH
jgi:hypothetical protein